MDVRRIIMLHMINEAEREEKNIKKIKGIASAHLSRRNKLKNKLISLQRVHDIYEAHDRSEYDNNAVNLAKELITERLTGLSDDHSKNLKKKITGEVYAEVGITEGVIPISSIDVPKLCESIIAAEYRLEHVVLQAGGENQEPGVDCIVVTAVYDTELRRHNTRVVDKDDLYDRVMPVFR